MECVVQRCQSMSDRVPRVQLGGPCAQSARPACSPETPSAKNRPESGLQRIVRALRLLVARLVRIGRAASLSRGRLAAQKFALWPQLLFASRKLKRPVFRPDECGLPVLLFGLARRWHHAVLRAKPASLLPVDISAKQAAYIGLTRARRAQWTAQPPRSAPPFGRRSPFLNRDRDDQPDAEFALCGEGSSSASC